MDQPTEKLSQAARLEGLFFTTHECDKSGKSLKRMYWDCHARKCIMSIPMLPEQCYKLIRTPLLGFGGAGQFDEDAGAPMQVAKITRKWHWLEGDNDVHTYLVDVNRVQRMFLGAIELELAVIKTKVIELIAHRRAFFDIMRARNKLPLPEAYVAYNCREVCKTNLWFVEQNDMMNLNHRYHVGRDWRFYAKSEEGEDEWTMEITAFLDNY